MIKQLIAAAICFVGSLGVITTPVFAEEQKPAIQPQISPVTNRVSLRAGEALEYTFNIDNIGAEAFTYKVYATPYSVTNESYQLNFSNENNRTQIARWITFKQEDGKFVDKATFRIEPGSKQTIEYRISVPKDIPSGGQYAVIFAEPEAPANKNSTGITAVHRVGLVIFGRTDGETKNSATITNFSLPTFLTHGKVIMNATVKNDGNTDFDAKTSMIVERFFGGKVYEKNHSDSILPETSRNISMTWEETPSFGVFRVITNITALDKTHKETKLIVIMPVFIIIITLILLTIIIVWTIILIKKRHDRKSRVIV